MMIKTQRTIILESDDEIELFKLMMQIISNSSLPIEFRGMTSQDIFDFLQRLKK